MLHVVPLEPVAHERLHVLVVLGDTHLPGALARVAVRQEEPDEAAVVAIEHELLGDGAHVAAGAVGVDEAVLDVLGVGAPRGHAGEARLLGVGEGEGRAVVLGPPAPRDEVVVALGLVHHRDRLVKVGAVDVLGLGEVVRHVHVVDDGGRGTQRLRHRHAVAELHQLALHLLELLCFRIPDQQALGVRDGHGATALGRDAEHAEARVVTGDRGELAPGGDALVVAGGDVHRARGQLEELHVAVLGEMLDLGRALGQMVVDPRADGGGEDLAVLHHDNFGVSGHGLDRRINQPLPTAHRVEEELLRGEALDERVLHEPAALGAVVVLGEVRQRAVVEAVHDALALHRLLPH